MADNKNNNKNKKTGQNTRSILKSFIGDDLTHELRQLIDLAVRKQLNPQEVVQRFTNTKYFRNEFPGLIEKNGTIADQLSGKAGIGVSVNNLASAISNYQSGLEKFKQEAEKYGEPFSKHQYAATIRGETSLAEFQARLQAVETIDANPALKASWEEQARAAGKKANMQDLYKAAVGAGDTQFRNFYEAAQFQTSLGFGQQGAKDLAKGGAIPVNATFDDINKLVSEVRGNLQGYAPELAAQGINAAKLVKVLGNPRAYTAEVDQIRALAEQRASLHGRPVVGSYAQAGSGGGLAQYDQNQANRTASYG